MQHNIDKPILAITLGDINGIGPEILVKALADRELWHVCRPLVVGDVKAIEACRQWAPDCPAPQEITGQDLPEKGMPVVSKGLKVPTRRPGVLDPEAGRCAVEWLKHAVREAVAGRVDGIVTCPINKQGIHMAGYAYPGHTEIIAEMTGSQEYRMCLFAGPLRIVHVSSHCPLAVCVQHVTLERVAQSIRVGHDALVRLGLERRHVAVAGLNPHAGEAGALGCEEETIIAPAIAQCKGEGIDCSGPYPPDTVFRRMHAGEFDLVVAMYHDQGHIPLKLLAMDEGVNVTLGVSVVRTSVDHGTAYDIAGQGIADEGSLCAAIRLAAQFATARNREEP